MFKRASLLVALASLAGLALVFLVGAAPAATGVPGGFDDQPVADAGLPTALAFTPGPDSRLLITGKDGQLWAHEEGTTGTTKALDISGRVCSGDTERGLLGVAADPNFATNGFVYLYYTYNKSDACPKKEPRNPDNPVNRVSRFKITGDTAADSRPENEKVLIDNIPSHNSTHNGGDVQFGRDGKLYASVGDGGCDYAEPKNCQYENDASRDKNVLLGKILRVNPEDGSIPADNPYADAANGVRCGTLKNEKAGGGSVAPEGTVCEETFARGLRNPFRMAFDPDAATTTFRINDVGSSGWEEIDEGRAGADYGWNICEGRHDNRFRKGSAKCAQAPLTPPIHEYKHSTTGCSSITGGAFVPETASWPDQYDDYLFGDFVCGKIFNLRPGSETGGETPARTTLATGLGAGAGPIAMTFGPNGAGGQALYYTTFAGGAENAAPGQVRRIVYTAP